ncbi:hypothetical protein [Caulobacter sp. 1776]|uniref:hypothetical protein n=1 Tax=Caulobacter sp. 1776 TaxID=3156420 RepID=UPI0033928DD7
MAQSTTSQLRQTLVEIDRQLLDLLLGQGRLDHDRWGKIAMLEHARGAVERLLLAAEAEEPSAGA